jgi:3-methylcrotonyl-CoA carboxylase alpha subunit
MDTTLHLRTGDQATTVTVEASDQVRIGAHTYEVREVTAGVYLVSDGQHRWTVAVGGSPDAPWVFAQGAVARVEIARAGDASGRPRRASPDHLAAPMPATVVKLLVEPGHTVSKGDTLLVLEAMKMELPVRAPRSGVVSRVLCRVGDLVQPGVDLLELA